MGSLSNLYISQSYTSLIHLGSDTTIVNSVGYVEFQDGLGNGLGISVNQTGDISVSGNIYATNLTGSKDFVSKSVFNTYTQSTDTKINNLNTISASYLAFTQSYYSTSASFDSRINSISSSTLTDSASFNTRINSVSSSLNTFSSSYKVDSASFDTRITNNSSSLNTFSSSYKVDSASFDSRVDVLESFSSSQHFLNGTFATTGSNTFNGNQNIVGSVTASAARIAGLTYPTADDGVGSFIQSNGAGVLSLQYVNTIFESVRNGESTTLTAGTPVYISGSQGTNPIVYRADASNPAKMPVIYVIQNDIAAGANGNAITLGLITGVTTTGYPAGTEIYVGEGGGWSASRPSGSNSVVQPLGIVTKEGPGGSGRGLVLNPGPISLPNIQTGYVWVGNGSNQPISVATSSFASLTDLTSLNQFTASQFVSNSLFVSTGSANSSSIGLLQYFSGSEYKTDSSSFNSRINAIAPSTQIESNGTIVGTATTLNFVGTGVNLSVGAGTASITINAGSGSGGGGTAGNSYTANYNGNTWVVNHNLNTSVPLVFAYESGSQWVIPAYLDVTSPNSVTLGFSSVVSGSIVVVNGGDQTVVSTITSATSATITHNLNTDWPIVQFYESSSKAQQIPQSVVSDSVNQITITFSTPVSGKVVIKK